MYLSHTCTIITMYSLSLWRFQMKQVTQQRSTQGRRLFGGSWGVAVCRNLPVRPCRTARGCRALPDHHSHGIVVKHSRHVLWGELVGGVGDQQAGFTDGSVTNNNAFDCLHLDPWKVYRRSDTVLNHKCTIFCYMYTSILYRTFYQVNNQT